MSDRLFFQKDGADLLEGVDLKCEKALPGGFTIYTVTHDGNRVCTLYCGFPQDFEPGYSHRLEKAVA